MIVAGLLAGAVAIIAAVLAVNLFTSFPGRDADTRAATDGGRAAHRSGSARAATSVVVALAPGSRPTPVPPSFLGLSTEYWSLPELRRGTWPRSLGCCRCCTYPGMAR